MGLKDRARQEAADLAAARLRAEEESLKPSAQQYKKQVDEAFERLEEWFASIGEPFDCDEVEIYRVTTKWSTWTPEPQGSREFEHVNPAETILAFILDGERFWARSRYRPSAYYRGREFEVFMAMSRDLAWPGPKQDLNTHQHFMSVATMGQINRAFERREELVRSGRIPKASESRNR